MSLRLKAFLLITSALGVLFFLVNLAASRVVSTSFLELEQNEVWKNTERATDALDNAIDTLEVKLGDWSQWDDTYRFMDDRNEEYLRSNLGNEAFGPLRINFVALLDTKGDIIFKKQVVDGKEEPFLRDFEKYLLDESAKYHGSAMTSHKDIAVFPEGAVIHVARPITSSDGTAPSRGTIVFGSFFDRSITEDLAHITHLDIESVPYDGQYLDKEFTAARNRISAENPIHIDRSDEGNMVSGYVVVPNEGGDPTLLLKISMERDIYKKGQESIGLFTVLTVLAAFAFIPVFFVLQDRLVLRKISSLSRQVEKIRESGSFTETVMLPGSDEFSGLAMRINAMLLALREAESGKKETEGRFRTVADSAPVMIWMSDITKKCTYVNKVWLDYTGRTVEETLGVGWKVDVHPEDVEGSEAAYETAFSGQRPFSVEFRLRRKDGSFGWVFSQAVPRFTVDGVFLGYIGSCIDITERKSSEEQKQRYIEEVEKMNHVMVERELKMVELKNEIKRLTGKA